MFSRSKLFALVIFIAFFSHVSSKNENNKEYSTSAAKNWLKRLRGKNDEKKTKYRAETFEKDIEVWKGEFYKYKMWNRQAKAADTLDKIGFLIRFIREHSHKLLFLKTLETILNSNIASKANRIYIYETLDIAGLGFQNPELEQRVFEILHNHVQRSHSGEDIGQVILSIGYLSQVQTFIKLSEVFYETLKTKLSMTKNTEIQASIIKGLSTWTNFYPRAEWYLEIAEILETNGEKYKDSALNAAVEGIIEMKKTMKGEDKFQAILNALSAFDSVLGVKSPLQPMIYQAIYEMALIKKEPLLIQSVFKGLNDAYLKLHKPTYLKEILKEIKNTRKNFSDEKYSIREESDDTVCPNKNCALWTKIDQ